MGEPVRCECGKYMWHNGSNGVGFWHTARGHGSDENFCDVCGTKLNADGTCGLSYAALEARCRHLGRALDAKYRHLGRALEWLADDQVELECALAATATATEEAADE